MKVANVNDTSFLWTCMNNMLYKAFWFSSLLFARGSQIWYLAPLQCVLLKTTSQTVFEEIMARPYITCSGATQTFNVEAKFPRLTSMLDALLFLLIEFFAGFLCGLYCRNMKDFHSSFYHSVRNSFIYLPITRLETSIPHSGSLVVRCFFWGCENRIPLYKSMTFSNQTWKEGMGCLQDAILRLTQRNCKDCLPKSLTHPKLPLRNSELVYANYSDLWSIYHVTNNAF